MVYLEHTPTAPLNRLISVLWYCRAPDLLSGRHRALPTGNLQIIFNLAGESLQEFRDDTLESAFGVPAAIVSGKL